jgi:hypothetical protein
MTTEEVVITSEMVPLIFEYAQAPRERDRIPFLDRLWDLAIASDPTVRQRWAKQGWLRAVIQKQMGDEAPAGSPHAFRDRESLRYAPDVLWNQVDVGLAMASAVNMLRDARALSSKKKITLEEAAVQTIAFYEKGNKKHTPDGKFFYVKATMVSAIVDGKNKAREARSDDSERTLWNNIRHNIGALVMEKIGEDIEPATLEEINTWFEGELSNLMNAFTKKLRARKTTVAVEYNRVQYVSACRTLHIDPSDVGKPIDVGPAKSAKKKLLRAYHPDANGGDTSLQHLCDQIVKAYDVVESYAAQMAKSESRTKKSIENRKGDLDVP